MTTRKNKKTKHKHAATKYNHTGFVLVAVGLLILLGLAFQTVRQRTQSVLPASKVAGQVTQPVTVRTLPAGAEPEQFVVPGPAQARFNRLLPPVQQQRLIDIIEEMWFAKRPSRRAQAQQTLVRVFRSKRVQRIQRHYGADFIYFLKGTTGWSQPDAARAMGQFAPMLSAAGIKLAQNP